MKIFLYFKFLLFKLFFQHLDFNTKKSNSLLWSMFGFNIFILSWCWESGGSTFSSIPFCFSPIKNSCSMFPWVPEGFFLSSYFSSMVRNFTIFIVLLDSFFIWSFMQVIISL